MNIEKDFEELYEGWKKGKYKITDDKGNIIGKYSSGSKAQKVVDDLMQQGKYDKLTVEIIEDLEKEASTYRDKQKKSKDKKQFGISRKKGNIRHGGSGYGEDIGEGYKDLPPHLQKLIKKIEKKQKDWNKQNPGAKIQTLKAYFEIFWR